MFGLGEALDIFWGHFGFIKMKVTSSIHSHKGPFDLGKRIQLSPMPVRISGAGGHFSGQKPTVFQGVSFCMPGRKIISLQHAIFHVVAVPDTINLAEKLKPDNANGLSAGIYNFGAVTEGCALERTTRGIVQRTLVENFHRVGSFWIFRFVRVASPQEILLIIRGGDSC